MTPAPTGAGYKRPDAIARNERVLDAWIAGVPVKTIAARLGMDDSNVRRVVHEARSIGDPRAVLRFRRATRWAAPRAY